MGDKEYIVGVDLGGTNIKAGLLNLEGKILSREQIPTLATSGYKKVIERIVNTVKKVLKKAKIDFSQVRGVGMGTPGRLDTRTGTVYNSPNLGWKEVHLKDILEKELKRPVFVGHDAAMVTWGEKHYGAGIDVDNLVCATLGTGIGIGIVIDGKLYDRSTGDMGHTIIDRNGPRCNCGGYGCLERLSSGPHIAAMAVERIKLGANTIIKEMVQGDLSAVEAKTVFDAARKSDTVALEIVEEIAGNLALGITNVIALINPELFIIGGNIANAREVLFVPIRKAIVKRGYFYLAEEKVVPAKLGSDGGIMGVAHCVIENLRTGRYETR